MARNRNNRSITLCRYYPLSVVIASGVVNVLQKKQCFNYYENYHLLK